MAFIYLYLASWVAGGVMLLSGLLLEQRKATGLADAAAKRRPHLHVPVSFFATGFGGAGLFATMAGLRGAFCALVSAGVGVVLLVFSLFLKRP